MAATWIDWGITIIIIGVVIGIFYRALQEPIDLVFNGLKKLLSGVRDKLADGGSEGATVIRYG
jgi:hypothetical protein